MSSTNLILIVRNSFLWNLRFDGGQFLTGPEGASVGFSWSSLIHGVNVPRNLLLLGLLTLGGVVAAIVVAKIGPRNIIGMIRYDQREEGSLRVGDRAPEVELLALDGKTTSRLSQQIGGRPLVLVFGSFT